MVKKSSEKKSPEKKSPEKKPPEKKPPEKKSPEKKSPEKKSPEKKPPEKKAPEKKEPVKKSPGRVIVEKKKKEESIDYARNYFKNHLSRRIIYEQKGYKEVELKKLINKLQEIYKNSEVINPDFLMLWHDLIDLEKIEKEIPIPYEMVVLWIKMNGPNFKGFPKRTDVIKSLYETLTWKDIYKEDIKQETKKIKVNYALKEDFKKKETKIYVEFFIVQDDSIWQCEQIDKEIDLKPIDIQKL